MSELIVDSFSSFMDEDGFLTIPEHCSIERARKDIIYGTELAYEGKDGQYSEWAVVCAFTQFKVGQRITWEEFGDRLVKSQAQQFLDWLVSKGLIETVWDSDKSKIGYRVRS